MPFESGIQNAESFAQRIQCSRDDKLDCLYIVRQLMELALVAREKGLVALDTMLDEYPDRYNFPFLRKAVELIVDVGNVDHIRKVLYQYIFSSNFVGRKFLVSVVIAEAVIAIHEEEDLEYIFYFLIPSLFGMEFESSVTAIYHDYRNSLRSPNRDE